MVKWRDKNAPTQDAALTENCLRIVTNEDFFYEVTMYQFLDCEKDEYSDFYKIVNCV